VTDDNSGVDTDTATVNIANVAPTAEAGGPYNCVVGDAVTLSGSGSDPGNDPLTYAWDLNNDGTYETAGQNILFSCAAEGSFPVSLRVTDGDGASGTDDSTVSVYKLTDVMYPNKNITAAVGDNQTLKIMLSSSRRIYGYQFNVVFNQSLLAVTSTEEGGFLKQGGASTYFNANINNSIGVVTYTCRYGTQTGVNGTDAMIIINFTAKMPGNGTISYSNVKFIDETLAEVNIGQVNGTIFVNDTEMVVNGVMVVRDGNNIVLTQLAAPGEEQTWWVDGRQAGTGSTFTYTAPANRTGMHYLSYTKGKGRLFSTSTWKVNAKIRGDVNGDGMVDIFDMAKVGIGMGAIKGASGWDQISDIHDTKENGLTEGDGKIDSTDMKLVGSNFGRSGK
jgi:hypothetical protein